MKDIVIEKAKRHYKCSFCNNEVLTFTRRSFWKNANIIINKKLKK